jgi:hypothetical protein
MPDDEWMTSTEGDLDPDLTEEAGYSGWDPPERRSWALAQRVVLVVVLLSLLGGALLLLTK